MVYRFTEAGEVKAVVPLLARGRLIRVLQPPFNSHTPVWDMACVESPTRVLDGLLHHLGLFADRVVFPSVVAGEPLHEGLVEAAARGGARVAEHADASEAYIDMTLGWEAYSAGRDKKTVQNYARKERQLSRLGRLECREIASDPHLEDILKECYALEHASWKGRLGSAIADRPETACFYTQMPLAASRAGALSLRTLRLDGRLIAFDLSLRQRTDQFSLKISYAPQFAKYSPGQVLLHMMIRELQGGGLKRLRLGPPSASKAIWTELMRPLVVMEITPARARARVLHWLGPGLRRRLRHVPLAGSLVASIREAQARHRCVRKQAARQEAREAETEPREPSPPVHEHGVRGSLASGEV
jgi:CelD/BcsL family acetyltransferase involved in cellulose biosynthesis